MYALRILVYTSFLDENEEIPFLSDVKCFLNKAQVLLHSGAAMLKAAVRDELLCPKSTTQVLLHLCTFKKLFYH